MKGGVQGVDNREQHMVPEKSKNGTRDLPKMLPKSWKKWYQEKYQIIRIKFQNGTEISKVVSKEKNMILNKKNYGTWKILNMKKKWYLEIAKFI